MIDYDKSALSALNNELIELIGWADTLTLLISVGRREFYFPMESSRCTRLIGVLADDVVADLCNAFGGLYITLPSSNKMITLLRNRQILIDDQRGISHAKNAELNGISKRQVNNILQKR